MACVVCQHCQEKLFKEDGVAVREGFSYHKKCHKCYVCSETNLHNAEVFQGVIFCCSCSQRIFQGCSTARRAKTGSRSKRVRSKGRSKRRERMRAQERRAENARNRPTNGVLELTRLAASSESESSHYKEKNHSRLSNALALSTELALQMGKEIYEENSNDLKKNSKEIGMTTEVTQELLRQMNCPVVVDRKKGSKPPSPTLTSPKEKGDSRYNKTIICSDLRIAELGASTEIAHMALRKKSEIPIIIKSESHFKAMESLTLSELNQESDVSGDDNDEWMESTYSMKLYDENRWLDRRIGSILKLPFKFFKRNILDRSSRITVDKGNNNNSSCILKRLKMLFHEEIVEHQHRGVKRLYSTINRRNTPYKLGWLNLMDKVSAVMRPELTIRERIEHPRRCKHFECHSYRCMRAHVMKMAGPTKSELACVRNKIKRIFAPKSLKRVIRFNKKCPAVMMSQACGSDVTRASLRNAKLN